MMISTFIFHHFRLSIIQEPLSLSLVSFEPHCEKTSFLYMRQNKDADQLRGYRKADQRLCFRNMDSTITSTS